MTRCTAWRAWTYPLLVVGFLFSSNADDSGTEAVPCVWLRGREMRTPATHTLLSSRVCNGRRSGRAKPHLSLGPPLSLLYVRPKSVPSNPSDDIPPLVASSNLLRLDEKQPAPRSISQQCAIFRLMMQIRQYCRSFPSYARKLWYGSIGPGSTQANQGIMGG